MNKWFGYFIITAVIVIIGSLYFTYHVSRHQNGATNKISDSEMAVKTLVLSANKLAYDGDYKRANTLYKNIITNYASSKEKPVAEQVARARYDLAMNYALSGDFKQAEKVFKELLDDYHGTKEPVLFIGVTICERAMFQRAICLHKLKSDSAATTQLVELIDKYPFGDRSSSAQELIRQYNNGKLTPAAIKSVAKRDELVAKEAKKKALERAMCGPKALEYICKYYEVNSSAKEIAKLAKTSIKGTTMLDLARAAEKLGLKTRGVEVNAKGLEKIEVPSILFLESSHYVVLKSCNKKSVVLVDPTRGIENTISKDQLERKWRVKVLEIKKS